MQDAKLSDLLVANEGSLPRLLYVADAPIEADIPGFDILYRLFDNYPDKRLLIVEGLTASPSRRRIDGAEYRRYWPLRCRLVLTRFHRYTGPIATALAPLGGADVANLVRDFRPQAVITVAEGYIWQAAAAYAHRAQLPLHLIVHDDWPNDNFPDNDNHFKIERNWKSRHIQRWYPIAASRLCVSPAMAEEYYRRYGAQGDVLYPSRAANGLNFAEPPDSLKGNCEPFTVAFAGSIYPEYSYGLQRMAIALQSISGRLIVYGRCIGKSTFSFLQEVNVEMRGMVSSSSVYIRECRRDAHAIYVPMSYREHDRINMQLSFPSKLADLTSIGLPLLVDGPEYCSAVRWTRENPGVAEVVTTESVNALSASVARLQDPNYRLNLARECIYQGQQYFSSSRALNLLYERLGRAS